MCCYLDCGQEDTLFPLSLQGGRRQQLKGLGGEEEGEAHQSRGGYEESRRGIGEDQEGTWSSGWQDQCGQAARCKSARSQATRCKGARG